MLLTLPSCMHTPYQMPLENMSVQSALVSGTLTLIVQQQLDGPSPASQTSLANIIATGVSAIVDDDTPTLDTDSRRASIFSLVKGFCRKVLAVGWPGSRVVRSISISSCRFSIPNGVNAMTL